MYDDVYSEPGKHNLNIIASIDWDDEPYQFDMTVVWQDKTTKKLYFASDSGCSCPSPFEDYRDVNALKPLTDLSQIEHLIKSHREPESKWDEPTPAEKCDTFFNTVKKAFEEA